MQVEKTHLEGILLIKPEVYQDARGFFLESYQRKRYSEFGLNVEFVQDNCSRSQWNTLRGLHFQRFYPQGKLVSVIQGCIFDVAVDIRLDSPTFGLWYGVELSDENHFQLWIPPGFAHGFCVLSASADFSYKCTEYYHPADEACIYWGDPDLNITWPFKGPVLSDKDGTAPALRELFPSRFIQTAT